jgi:Domain of unknown function (DUF5615)
VKLLLDEHVHPAVAEGVRRAANVEIVALKHWEDGKYLNTDDAIILRTAHASGWTLVTFDQRTIRSTLRDWGEKGEAHAGVIFADGRTIAQSDVGGPVRSLLDLIARAGGEDWENRVEYLRRVR